jgi:hypothetical protein
MRWTASMVAEIYAMPGHIIHRLHQISSSIFAQHMRRELQFYFSTVRCLIDLSRPAPKTAAHRF